MSQSRISSFFRKRGAADIEASSSNAGPSGNASRNDNREAPGIATTDTRHDTSELEIRCERNIRKIDEKRKKQKLAQDFDQAWQVNRPWLKYVENDGMYCTFCKKFNKTPFGRGVWNIKACVRIRLSSIREHEHSAEHQDSVKRELEASKTQNVATALTAPVQISTDGMVQAFQCLYFLCKNNIAHTTNFTKLLGLEKCLGVDILEKIQKGNNAKYTSETAIKEMLACLSEVIENDILTELKNSESYALMFDETTDISVIEQMVIHGRYIDTNGYVKVRYLKVLDALAKPREAQLHGEFGDTENDDVQKDIHELDTGVISLNADTICSKVVEFIEQNKLRYEALHGIGTDGAAVMTGRLNGAVKKIIDTQVEKQKDKNKPGKLINKAVGAHCAAHKLNLAAKQAGTWLPAIQRFKRVLNQLHAFYSRSAVRSSGLKAIQELLHDTLKESGKVSNPSETRWLALGECALKLKNILTSVVVSLEREATERADMTAAGLVNLMTRFEFVAILILLCEVLPTVNRLSCQFQKTDIDFPSVNTVLSATIASLEAKKQTELTEEVESIEGKFKARGISLKYSGNLKDEISHFTDNTQRKFIERIIENLNNRFQHTDIMSSFSRLFSPETYTEETVNINQLCYHVEKLSEQFGIPKETAKNEVNDFVFYVQAFKDDQLKQEGFLKKITTSSVYNFPLMTKLARIYRVLPPHTADCERDFSKMKIIKTDIRNRMAENTLDYLMRISLEGPPLENYPFASAVHLWACQKDRRYKVRLS